MFTENFHHLSDEALLAYYHTSRNIRAFSLLYQRHKDSIFRYCSQMNSANASRIVEELWKNILERPPNLYDRLLRSWLFINANNLLNSNCDETIEQNTSEKKPSKANTITALQQLSRIERNIFLLHIECNLPLATVADIEKIPLRICRAHYRTCKERLESILHGSERKAWIPEVRA
jgi:DNA-directed RNA polymerase specialized sigma24 family protein